MAVGNGLAERIAKMEGILEQHGERLSRIEDDLRSLLRGKADKWEVRIWFLVLIALISIFEFLR